ncbi:hypothetical protein GQ464_000315 [Rhodocaloribacter litoris]|uniref:hypothetical protein n=1 Tax=Rhodocaloribacter litoris TaxID=2558931 RepID=UPI0014227C7E|nr:hypothetical protein [Rhodocaloribacter litoris]QXD15437.1 hypothetical protein GQ464_000315 [Rhodocaloribacter litoris]
MMMPVTVRTRGLVALLLAWLVMPVGEASGQEGPVFVDETGVMRWRSTGEEVALFGVNYGVPFAHGYRALGYVGADRKRAIDQDVAHFARLGLDAYRIHVWDRQITDRHGNLIENDHLDLLDYLLARLAERGIRTILTPIAWWGAGYPEPDPGTGGISDYYSKGEMTTDPEARRAQVNYLRQFIAHVNPYTGYSYRDDPAIIAVELFNEPSHPGGAEETTRFIDTLADALREAGFRKPIFYNISQGYTDAHGRAVCAARIDGVSVQWYPTGLVRGAAVGGNMLPNVDHYPLPFADFPDCRNKARMVYEFDAADVAGSYLYPAMARSFREAGFQWATQFAYDPLAFAWANTDYQTHFLNLVYTPGRAIGFMIAGEVFRRTPRGAAFGTYPETSTFGPFRVRYEDDLSELVADTVFYHSNDTQTIPPAPAALRHVAGVGSSPVVTYAGTGAYFLDRLGEGLWRLEVYPDVAWVEDPFSRPSLRRPVARVLWRDRRMRVALPDLGPAFTVEPVDAGNVHRPAVRDGAFVVRPGVYVLARPGVEVPAVDATFFVPPPSPGPPVVRHTPPEAVTAGRPFTVQADVVTAAPPDSVWLLAGTPGGGFRRPRPLRMTPGDGFTFAATLPAGHLTPGWLSYRIVVFGRDGTHTFPGGDAGHPFQWDFTGRATWDVPVVSPDAPVVLFDARRDRDHLLAPAFWNYVRYRLEPSEGTAPDRPALRVVVESLAPEPGHFALRTFLTPAQRHRLAEAPGTGTLRIRARAAGASEGRLEVALVEQDGTAWGTVLELTEAWQEYTVPLAALRRTPLALLPRPYPQFLPYLFDAATPDDAPEPRNLDGLQFAIDGAWFDAAGREVPRGFDVERIVLE